VHFIISTRQLRSIVGILVDSKVLNYLHIFIQSLFFLFLTALYPRKFEKKKRKNKQKKVSETSFPIYFHTSLLPRILFLNFLPHQICSMSVSETSCFASPSPQTLPLPFHLLLNLISAETELL